MEGFTKLFSVLVITIIMAQESSAQLGQLGEGKELIDSVCKVSPTKDLCLEVLNSDPILSPNANLKELAIISLRVAAKNASGILNEVKRLIDDDNLDPEIQQGLADCKQTILDAESQLEDTIASLLVDNESDSKLWLKAALAAITTCDNSIPGNDDILSIRSIMFRKLCNIAIALSISLPLNNVTF